MSYLSLTLLGGFNATLDGEPLTTFETAKARALLALLATESTRPHRRTELAAMLWPNSSEERAARNLSQTLVRLRRALPMASAAENPFLLTSRQDVWFNPYSNHQLDVTRFRELIHAYRQHRHESGDTCNACVQWLEQAVALYRGEFLAGLFVRDSINFEEWRLAQQEELHREVIEALTQLTGYFERQGQYQQVLTFARQHIKLEPWSDLANLRLMQASVACGQQDAAVRQYEAYAQILAQELGISPSHEATVLYKHLKRDRTNSLVGANPSTNRAPVALNREELRPVTVLVCKRRSLSQEQHAELPYAEPTWCKQCCENIVNLYGGHRLPLIGEKCLISFGYPRAQEDAPCRAVRTGLAMISEESICGRDISIGIHTGTMLIHNKYDAAGQLHNLIGNVPEIARDCQHFAQSGTVLVTEATERLIRNRFDCRALGQYSLTRLSHPLELYQVLGEHKSKAYLGHLAQTSSLTKLVGRQHELAQLWASWRQVYQKRQGRVIWLGGEPGIGKSRLIWEFKRRVLGQELENQAEADGGGSPLPKKPLWLESHCLPQTQNTNLHPIVDAIEQLLDFRADDSPVSRSDKLAAALNHLDLATLAIWHLSLLLNLPTEIPHPQIITSEQQTQMAESFVLLLQKYASQQQPIVLVIEDLHWSDPSTIEWLSRSFSALASVPCQILLTCRPVFSPPWLVEKHLLHLGLEPLNPSQSAEMVSHIAGDRLSDREELGQRIVQRAQGNPFFVEELTKALIDALALEMDIHQTVKEIPDVPTVLHHLLLAQFDVLGAAKETAYWAAILGNEFSHNVLCAITGFNEQRLQSDLAKLNEANLVVPMNQRAHSKYSFGHALIQETVYAALPKHVRVARHRRVAETLEEHFSSVAEQSPQTLAHHFEQGGLISQAVDYWLLAGQTATKQGAAQEARIFFDRAVELIEPDDAERCWKAIYGREAVLDLLGERAAQEADIMILLEWADILDDDTKRAQAYLRREKLAGIQGNHSIMIQAADSAIAAARRANNLSLEMYGSLRKMQGLTNCGKKAEVQRLVEEILFKIQEDENGLVPSSVLGHMAFYYMETGDLYRAVQLVKQSVEAARREGDTLVESKFNMNLGFTYAQLGLYEQAQVALETGLAQAKAIGNRRLQATYTINLGFVYWRHGSFDKARTLLQAAHEEFSLVGEVYGKWASLAYLGFMGAETKDWRRAADCLQRAQAGFTEIDMIPDMLEVQAARAYCLLGQEKLEEAWHLAQETWKQIHKQGVEGMDSPALAHLYLIKVFGAIETPESQACRQAAIEAGYSNLMQAAAKISSPEWRRSFLENVAENREMVGYWQPYQAIE